MTIDVIKFFQGFIKHMVSIGGINLPKSISISMGRKLADYYIKRDIKDWRKALTAMIEGMGGSIDKIEETGDGKSYLIVSKYMQGFCPIGGDVETKNSDLIVNSVCIPYTTGFISKFLNNSNLKLEFIGCIPRDGNTHCRLLVKITI
ncbi:MAG: hypothetical protein ACTSRZ_13055 [Promethearchaeota archaeon]